MIRARYAWRLAAALMAISGARSEAIPPARPSVAACIHDRAAGRNWLEKTLWGLYDQEAGWIGAEIHNSNGTDDLGPLQVNSSWVPVVASRLGRDGRDVRRWLRDDPCFNVGVAAWLFLSGYRLHGDFWGAVGAYHSPHRDRARQYAVRVADRLRRRFGETVFRTSSRARGGR